MRAPSRIFVCVALAIGIWMVDSLILCVVGQVPFFDALFYGASSIRLLIRLILVALILMLGFADILRYISSRAEIIRMNKADNGLMFGREDSDNESERILYHCLRLATVLKMRSRDKDKLRLLCYCHDIGRVCVPDNIWYNKASLSPSEQAVLDRHIDIGSAICSAIPRLQPVASMVAAHEEHYDGSGVKSMYGRSIPLSCRIFTIASLYDCYTSPNEQRPALDKESALDEMMLYRGTLLDPDVFDAFCLLMRDDKLANRITEHVYMPQ